MLKILIIADSIERGKRVLECVSKIETECIICKTKRWIKTQGGTEYIVIPPKLQYLIGQRADQVILDYTLINSLEYVVKAILCDSYIPTIYQIIDDKKILV